MAAMEARSADLLLLFSWLVRACRYKLNIWDVGGQTSLRSYWRNYFEQTDGLIWVVDSADRARLHDCRAELEALLQQEVRTRRAATSAALLAANARLLPC